MPPYGDTRGTTNTIDLTLEPPYTVDAEIAYDFPLLHVTFEL